jgi:predicted glycosyl hydrolase (DUF1957 family)
MSDKLNRYLQELHEAKRRKKQRYKDNSVGSRTAAKRRYNEKNYASVHVHLDKDLVLEFRRLCKEYNISQASVVKFTIESFIESFEK